MSVNMTLEDIIYLNYGLGLPERSRKDGDVPVYGSSGIAGWHNQALVNGSGIIIGRKGTIGSVHWSDTDFFPIDTTYYVVTKGDHNPRYIYYLLRTLKLDQLNTDAAVPGLNRTNALRQKIPFNTRSAEDAIADVLSTYDSLINNDKRRIVLLEQAAQQLHKEWFVRLRFPGHEKVKVVDGVPEGWKKTTLGKTITLNYGKALKADHRNEGDYPVYGSSGIVGSHDKYLVNGPGIIVGRKGNVGSVYWSSKNYFPIDTVYFIVSSQSNLYLYYALKNMNFISTDVAVPGLNRDFAYSREILEPSIRVLDDFFTIVTPIHEQIEKLTEMNAKLVSARDLLLPRLMNGEIRV